MFTISKGRLRGECISFVPPEGFDIVLRRSGFDGDGFKFVSADNSVAITVCLETDVNSVEEQINLFLGDNGFYRIGETFLITRGRGKGSAVYCGRFPNSSEIYYELHLFRKNGYRENCVSVCVQAQDWRRTNVNAVYEILGLPQIKAFLDSIEYFGFTS